jgi:hypothetical protein
LTMLSDPTRRTPGASSMVVPSGCREAYRRDRAGRRVETLYPTGYF